MVEVKGIIKANAELRNLLEAELLEDIAQNTSQISPGFDIAKYRESLQCSYGYLKLYSLDSTDRVDAVKLWSMFIEQTVREALPPMRYELPLDLKRQLQEEGRLEDDLSPEALENYRRDYWQQPARKVLGAIADSDRGVILGDPGAGKSTLLQYLALDWVEGQTETLPLLIELREYALAPVNSFLEFLHCGRGADWQFDQKQLHEHLLEEPTLVMFDGLDEVFARSSQAAIIDEIIRFSQQYPQVKVLVTSRIIGYNPERFQHAGFRQFTIQPLDKSEIHEFIERWYDLAMGIDGNKERLKKRLKDAITNSPAIKNLADNPLLLTMMAILNRRQELPRDRADLYDQASRVLLYHWDVDHKRLQLPLDTIGRREKQEILRLIAYQMQAGEEGLKGNLISAEQLTGILTSYLREQGFSEPREKASLLIKQLRERNFILCYRGADTYGFVHRTFLEYFCAVEIVNRFEKQQVLSFEELRDEVFGQHWQDETWHEVLRLIAGTINEEFAGNLINSLINQNSEHYEFDNIFFAALCLSEIKNRSSIKLIDDNLLKNIKSLIEYDFDYNYEPYEGERCERVLKIRTQATSHILSTWKEQKNVIHWLEKHPSLEKDVPIFDVLCQTLNKNERVKLEFVEKDILVVDDDSAIRKLLKRYLTEFHNYEVDVVKDGVEALSSMQNKLYDVVIMNVYMPRMHGVKASQLITNGKPSIINIKNDNLKNRPWIIGLTSGGTRLDCLTAGMDDYLSKPFDLRLISQALPNFRNIKKKLIQLTLNKPDYINDIKSFAHSSKNSNERLAAVRLLFQNHQNESDTLVFLKNFVSFEPDIEVRWVLMELVINNYCLSPPEIFNLIKSFFRDNCNGNVRESVVKALAKSCKDLPGVFDFIADCVLQDPFERKNSWQINPRQVALECLLNNYPKNPKTLELLRDRATNDPDEKLRNWAKQQLQQQTQIANNIEIEKD